MRISSLSSRRSAPAWMPPDGSPTSRAELVKRLDRLDFRSESIGPALRTMVPSEHRLGLARRALGVAVRSSASRASPGPASAAAVGMSGTTTTDNERVDQTLPWPPAPPRPAAGTPYVDKEMLFVATAPIKTTLQCKALRPCRMSRREPNRLILLAASRQRLATTILV
jgi:hypothetical protein